MDSSMFLNWVINMLMKKIVVPSEYHEQCKAVRSMYNDDVTGLVDSLTDYYVDSATIDFRFETDNDNLTQIFNNWLETVNIGFGGEVPTGIKALEKEYYKERVKYSSFPVLKLHKWERVGDLILPTKMYFLDGESIYAKDNTNDKSDNYIGLLNYDYYLGSGKEKQNKLKSNRNVDYIFTKPFARWHDEYPTPYCIKRGIYHNYKIIYSLKEKQNELLDQVLPYLLLIKKGSPELFMKGKTVTQQDLDKAIEQMQDVMDEMKSTNVDHEGKQIKTPMRATDFSEEIKHLIPDLKAMFQEELFTVSEKNILSALGFIDIAEAVSSNRKESVLNPSVFLEGVNSGVKDFQQILYEVYLRIKQRNANNIKYMNAKTLITHAPITTLMNNELRNFLRQQYDKGNLSRRTAVEVLGTNFEAEVMQIEKEQRQGLNYICYPPVTQNQEQYTDTPKDFNDNEIPDDKLDPNEQKNKYINARLVNSECPYCEEVISYNSQLEKSEKTEWIKCIDCGEEIPARDLAKRRTKKKPKSYNLEGAPYTRIAELPPAVKKKLSPKQQKKWMEIFNNAYNYKLKQTKDSKKAEQYAFRVAWSRINSISESTEKKSKINMEALADTMKNILEEHSDKLIKQLESSEEHKINQKKSQLLDNLLKKD